jgi:hypothetical protein
MIALYLRPLPSTQSEWPRLLRIDTASAEDFRIVDEMGREVWATEWVRAAWKQTAPQGVVRSLKLGHNGRKR